MKRKIIYTFLLVLVMVLMVGCGAQDDTQPPQTDATISTEAKDSPTQETTAPDVQYEIRLGYAEAARLFDKEFENFEILIDEVGYTISYYSDCSFATIDEIKTYESMWQDLSNDANAISSSLTAKLPPKEYEEIWNAYVSCINQLAALFAKGNDLDVNHDGTYTGDELQNVTLKIGYVFVDISNEAVEMTKELKTLSEKIAASLQTPTDNDEKTDSDNSNASIPFTNEYGTPTTKCAHTGCNNYIANSGDTNCCKEHSNRCLDCNKYIDEDAYWCVSCIAAAAKPACEACGKDATHTITGITGQTEYYCTEHYNEMKDLLEWMENN